MKTEIKVLLLLGAWICGISLQAYFTINDYVLITVLVVGCGAIWFFSETKIEKEGRKESQDLMNQIRSTTNDAKMKKKQLLTMVQALPYPILMLDQFGKIVLYNTRMETFGSLEDIKGMTYLKNGFDKTIQEFLKDAFIFEKELNKQKRISNRDYELVSVPIRSHGRFSGCLILIQDITRALLGEKMQKRFIADASHELKTPIAAIRGMVEILNRDDFDDEATQKDFLQQIEKEIMRLDLIVKDMLELSRMSISDPILDRHHVSLEELLDTAVKTMEPLAQEKQLLVKTDYGWTGRIFLDPQKFSQIIVNLLSNAIKYSDSGTITVRTRSDDDHVIVTIQDEGVGMNEQQLERIFERFYRVDSDRSRHTGGSGLGLAIVKSIVEAHGAAIWVESKVNQGTAFHIKLKQI